METQINLQTCPKCEKELARLNSGTLICRSCGWTSKKKKPTVNQSQSAASNQETTESSTPSSSIPPLTNNQPLPQKPNLPVNLKGLFGQKSLHSAGKLFFFLGLIVMFAGSQYDTTVCERDSFFPINCSHNIGLLNHKSNLINIGGFLFVGGCFLLTNTKE
jgi:hypothetical protein